MDKIKKLQTNKIIRELEYIESDLVYKSEIVTEADNSFIQSLNLFLDKNPMIKEVFDKKINVVIEKHFNQKPDNGQSETSCDDCGDCKEEEIKEIEKKPKEKKIPKLKKLYREIVKTTHPDKVENRRLNELYLRATKFYEENDLPGTFSVCLDLDIDFEIDDEETQLITNKINQIRDRINFMESTMTWKWYATEDDNIKDKILLEYIQIRLNN